MIGGETEERDIILNERYGDTWSRTIWSYAFPINIIDDFQIAIPNPNKEHYQGRKAWSES